LNRIWAGSMSATASRETSHWGTQSESRTPQARVFRFSANACESMSESPTQRQGRRILTLHEMRDLVGLLRSVFSRIAEIRRDNRLARHIQFPKIPSILSESLVVHLLRSGDILPDLSGYSFSLGGKRADILAERPGETKTIEVKATGKSAFQNFVAKDVDANYIIWIHFGDYFAGAGKKTLRAFVLREPKRYFSGRVYVNLKDLPRKVPDLVEVPVAVERLEHGAL